MCEKCKYYQVKYFLSCEKIQSLQGRCLKCKEKFPWLTESQFKEKINEKNM